MSSAIWPCLLLASLLINLSCSKDQSLLRTEKKSSTSSAQVSETRQNPCEEFDKVNTLVRDGAIDRKDAQDRFRRLIPKIREYFHSKGGKEADPKSWVFPVKGYGVRSIGGTNGSGYLQSGYDYFDGNRHGGHPAHDIFINDKNQDEMDDAKGKPVDVLSMSSGVVVARAAEWKPGSELRGGKYLYIYDPVSDGLFYYAHNREISVQLGEIVKPGVLIATVGRTGKNANPSRSPTHLHIMYLTVEDGYPKPKDIYQALLSAKSN